jgi:transcription elongation factor GreA
MSLYLIPSDAELIKEKITLKEAKLLELGQALGDAMSRSGSFPASNPEYAAVHLDMKNVQNNLDFLKAVLAKYSVLEEGKANNDIIGSYSVVVLRDKETEEQICHYVTLAELDKKVDVNCSMVTPESPVGKALLGHKLGDKIAITLPAGTRSYTITGHGKEY